MRTGFFGGRQHVAIEHGAGTGDQFRSLITQHTDRLKAELGTQGDFQRRQTTSCQRIGQRQDVLLTGDGNHRQDACLGTQLVDQGDFIRHRYVRSFYCHGS